MGILIENRPIGYIFCGYGPNQGKESQYKDRRGIMHEVKWTCGKCGMVIRCDEKLEVIKPKEDDTKDAPK